MELYKKRLSKDPNLVAYWRLESDGTDSSGSGYTVTGTTRGYVSGKYGNGVDVESGNSDYLTIADASCPNLEISGSQTWSCWYKPEGGVTGYVMGKSPTNAANYFGIAVINNGAVQLQVTGLTTNTTVNVPAGTCITGQWNFICGVYDQDNSLLKIYVNGTKAEATASGNHADTNGDFSIGKLGVWSDAGNYADGVIDDVAIWNRALDDAEVVSLYIDAGLLGYWKCNEYTWNGTANEVGDYSGNAEHGIAVGGAVTNASGKLNRCALLDGDDDRVDCGTIALAGTAKGSMQCWFKAADGEFDSIKALCGENEIFWLQGGYPNVGDGRFAVNTNGWDAVEYTATDLDDGNWHHMLGTYDGAKVHLYVDGTEVGTGTTATGNLWTDGVFKIGADASNNIEFGGSIDEVAVWNRVISSTEVSVLRNGGLGFQMMREMDKIHTPSIKIGKIWNGAIGNIRTVSGVF